MDKIPPKTTSGHHFKLAAPQISSYSGVVRGFNPRRPYTFLKVALSALQVFSPTGWLGGQEANPPLLQDTTDAINQGAKAILVDFTHVTFVDSMGVGILVRILKRAEKGGCHLYLCSMNSSARMIMDMIGVDQVFDIHADRQSVEMALADRN
ncbi:MAG: STAS domain-containing protein [Thermosynechococcaceae cyanobacterium]